MATDVQQLLEIPRIDSTNREEVVPCNLRLNQDRDGSFEIQRIDCLERGKWITASDKEIKLFLIQLEEVLKISLSSLLAHT